MAAIPAAHALDLPPEALSATQAGRVYVGYYPTWSDNAFDATGRNAAEVYRASRFARTPANYTHVMVAFGDPDFSWKGLVANDWSGTGISFKATPRDIQAAVRVLHRRNMKVMLAIGGATYHRWDGLAAEGAAGGGPRTTALARFLRDMDFDGLDVDYEADANVERYAHAAKALKNAVDAAGGGRLLSVAAWSTGAHCTMQTAADASCAGKVSTSGGKAGRERLLVSRHPAVADAFDMVHVMSYDARYEDYDGVTAYQQYRELFTSRTIVSIGLQSAPEGWPGGMLVVDDADAQCEGSRNLKTPYGATIHAPYSVARYAAAVTGSTSARRHPRDGAMLWSILKTADLRCGTATVASPGTIGRKIAPGFGLVDDPLLQQPEWK